MHVLYRHDWLYKVIYTRTLAQNCLIALWSGVRQRKLDLEQLWNCTWSLPFWDKTMWTLMELSDSMTTKDQAIDAKEPDGLMEGVWAKGALGGLDDGQRLLGLYFFENHCTWYIKRTRIKKTLEWFQKQVASFFLQKGVIRMQLKIRLLWWRKCYEQFWDTAESVTANPSSSPRLCWKRWDSKRVQTFPTSYHFLHAGRSIGECDPLWGVHRKRICTGERVATNKFLTLIHFSIFTV